MSFYSLYTLAHSISPVIRGLGRLIEGGKWINWYGDGAWRNLTPPMEEWSEAGGVCGLRSGRTLQFSRYDRDVSWPREMYGECYPLTAEEKEYLYAIYERVYLRPEAENAAERAMTDECERMKAEGTWLRQLEQVGRAG